MTTLLKSLSILLLIITNPSFGQMNGSFETWDTTYAHIYSADMINYGVTNPLNGSVNKWQGTSGNYGLCRSEDSYSGTYSLIMHTWYTYVNQEITYTNSINYRPQFLQGVFKYITGGNVNASQGKAVVYLTKLNGSSIDTIGTGIYLFDSTTIYSPFQLTINYTSSLTPDNISIVIKNSRDQDLCNNGNNVCHLLYLDDLKLSNNTLSISNIENMNANIHIYPNPILADQDLFIRTNEISNTTNIKIANTLGQVVVQQAFDSNSNSKILTLPNLNLSQGVYYLTLETTSNKATRKIIITR